MAASESIIIGTLVNKDGTPVLPITAFKKGVVLDSSSIQSDESGFSMFGKYVGDNSLDEKTSSVRKFVVYDPSDNKEMGTIECPFQKGSEYETKVMNGEGELIDMDSVFTVEDGRLSLSGGWKNAAASSGSNRYFLSIPSSKATDVTGSIADSEISRFSPTKGIYFDDNCNIWGVSDERIKDIISDLTVDPEDIRSIRKVFFKFKDADTDAINIGVTAQSVEAVYPELVTTGEDGTKAVAYDKLAVVALAAVDSLQSKFDEVSSRLAAIEKILKKD